MISGEPLYLEDLSPDVAAWRPVALLKKGLYGCVSLVRKGTTSELFVARELQIPQGEDEVQATARIARTYERFAAITHPALQRLVEQVPGEHGLWIISEFHPGYPLDFVQARCKTFEVSAVVGWICQILEGLQVLHEQPEPIAVGALEPSTLCVTKAGMVIVDLRIYEHAFPERAALLMARHQHHLAPEETSAVRVNVSADIYGVGSIAYWLLTGQVPEVQSTVAGNMMAVHLHHMRPDVDPALVQALSRLLSFHPHERPATAWDALALLAPFRPPQPTVLADLKELPPLGEGASTPWLPPQRMQSRGGAEPKAPAAPEPPPPAPELPKPEPEHVPHEPHMPPLAAAWHWLEDVTWPLFHGDPRALVASIAVLAVLLIGFVALARASRPAPPPVAASSASALMHVFDGKVYMRANDQARWQYQGDVTDSGTQVMASLALPHSALAFGADGSVRLSNDGAFHVDVAANSWDFTVMAGRIWIATGTGGAVQVIVPGAVLTVPTGGSVEVTTTSDNGVSGATVIDRKGSIAMKLNGSDSTLIEGDQVALRSDLAQPEKSAPGAPDAWESWNLGWDTPASLPLATVR
ncbi:MAG: protein kinase domain-containing protein [Candidatus Xenobia bacterium]